MNSSKPYKVRTAFVGQEAAYSDLPLNSDLKLLIEPYLDRRVLLKQFEDEIDRWEQNFATSAASTSTRHPAILTVCTSRMKIKCFVRSTPELVERNVREVLRCQDCTALGDWRLRPHSA
jgi:hypothetical protein